MLSHAQFAAQPTQNAPRESLCTGFQVQQSPSRQHDVITLANSWANTSCSLKRHVHRYVQAAAELQCLMHASVCVCLDPCCRSICFDVLAECLKVVQPISGCSCHYVVSQLFPTPTSGSAFRSPGAAAPMMPCAMRKSCQGWSGVSIARVEAQDPHLCPCRWTWAVLFVRDPPPAPTCSCLRLHSTRLPWHRCL